MHTTRVGSGNTRKNEKYLIVSSVVAVFTYFSSCHHQGAKLDPHTLTKHQYPCTNVHYLCNYLFQPREN